MVNQETNTRPVRPQYPALSLPLRALLLTLAVAQFFIGHGPVWRRGINWDYSILYSYASIPILVALALALKRRLAWVPWLLHSIEIGCVKFGVTAGFLLALLIIRGGPGFDGGTKGASPTEVVSPSRPTAKSVTSVHIRARDANGGTVNGTIRGQDGQPLRARSRTSPMKFLEHRPKSRWNLC